MYVCISTEEPQFNDHLLLSTIIKSKENNQNRYKLNTLNSYKSIELRGEVKKVVDLDGTYHKVGPPPPPPVG